MAIPTHDYTCITKAFATECPDCKERVFYFSCSCGSKVFFDSLGAPWPEHDCRARQIRETIAFVKNIERMTDDEIHRVIEQFSSEQGIEVPEHLWDMIEFEVGKRKYPLAVNELECDGQPREIYGRVMQVNQVNLYKKFGLTQGTDLSEILLGELSGKEWQEYVIRENPDKRNRCDEVKVLMDKIVLKTQKPSLKQNDTLAGILKPVKLATGNIWVIAGYTIC